MLMAITFGFSLVLGLTLLSTRWVPKLTLKPLPTLPSKDLKSLQAYISAVEQPHHPKPGTEKLLLLPPSQPQKSPTSFLYLHGFSASRQEISPVIENLARSMNSPLFMTRFSGHGLGAEELGETKWTQWIDDALEAYVIGASLGDEMIITCMSTGCALGLYLAHFYPEKIKALILLSPNFSPANPLSFLANGPLGPLMTKLVLGDYRTSEIKDPRQAYFWTTQYRTNVIPEMITLVTAVKNLDFKKIQIPVLTVYTKNDDVVSVQEIEENIPRLPNPRNQIVELSEATNHVLAGDIMNSNLNAKLLRICEEFLKNLDLTEKKAS